MYLVGGPHPNKAEAQILLERVTAEGERLATDAEVLQEILHRYTAINRRNAIEPAMKFTLDLVDEVFPIEKVDVFRASEITRSHNRFSARDSIHLAIMERYKIRSILSFDADFESWPGLRRFPAP
jgi:predicted nucleic acid-binding protein